MKTTTLKKRGLLMSKTDVYKAVKALRDACVRADADGDLSDEIDGSLLNAVGAALASPWLEHWAGRSRIGGRRE
jgi:hypothetical protein